MSEYKEKMNQFNEAVKKKCGCGKPVRYMVSPNEEKDQTWACNEHFRCLDKPIKFRPPWPDHTGNAG